MNEPRRHHYVPQFYFERFTDDSGLFWVWDKANDRIFRSGPQSIAVEVDFYRLHEFEEVSHDPWIMEKQLSDLERETARITEQWIDWIRVLQPGEKIPIPQINREIVSPFMAIQFLRTSDSREVLCSFIEEVETSKILTRQQKTNIHVQLMWDEDLIARISDKINNSVWVFALNATKTPFMASDNPVAFRVKDNSIWVKIDIIADGNYAVYPLASDIIMFCYDRQYWDKLGRFDSCLSPVTLTCEMIDIENTGQVFMAKQFLVCSKNDFQSAKMFSETIGTNKYERSSFDPKWKYLLP